MPASEADLFRRLDDLGIATETRRHPPVATVEESKALRGEIPGAHSKNLFLKDKKGGLWLIVTLEDKPIDMKELRRRIGSPQLSFAKPELLAEALAIEPGAVTPFAVLNDREGRVRVVLDEEMMASARLNYHPLTNAATTSIRPDDLVAFLRACGHEPEVVWL